MSVIYNIIFIKPVDKMRRKLNQENPSSKTLEIVNMQEASNIQTFPQDKVFLQFPDPESEQDTIVNDYAQINNNTTLISATIRDSFEPAEQFSPITFP